MAIASSPTLQFLGAAGGVTGSKFLFSINSDQVLIDCGLFQGLKDLRQRNWAPVPIDLARLRAVILTHAHIDHSGYLPRVVAKGFKGPVYATPGTCDLLRVMLPDSAHLQEEEARYANRKGYSKHAPALPLYTVEDAEATLKLLRPVRAGEKVEAAKGIVVDFGRVGHILGAGSARFAFAVNGQKKVLLDSGDLGRYDRPILKDPEPGGAADWLLIESTYGNRIHPKDSENELRAVIKETATERRCLVIPAFAIGRTQELVYTIRKMEDAGEIPTIPVYVDSPMGIEATEIYSRHTEEHDFEMARLSSSELSPLRSRHMVVARTPEQSKAINAMNGPLIIISASGMATGGRVLHHLKQRLPNPDTTVLLAGFQAEGTRGRSLQDGAKEIKMLGEVVPVRAQVKVLDGFSAHADQGEIMRWLGTIPKAPKTTYIVHGEAAGANALADLIRQRLKWNVEIAKFQQKVVLT
ncbi:MAG TPA: MBL fold metallo-hydrolase [Candidatus Limnocylindrales bacterium]|nr:MBL fold metallo-hydrolase [Candidatus Limnocylindrales bacterium]